MNTHNIPFPIQNEKIYRNLQPREFLQGTQERVRNSRGKRAISVRATEVLLYLETTKRVIFIVHTLSITLDVSACDVIDNRTVKQRNPDSHLIQLCQLDDIKTLIMTDIHKLCRNLNRR